jgi:uncharacterized protein YjbI with pentapeptide repeats
MTEEGTRRAEDEPLPPREKMMEWLRGGEEGVARFNRSRQLSRFNPDLVEASLNKSNLQQANFSGANLSEADLSGSDLRGADLRGADLRGADLSRVDLRGADLRGAGFQEANLGGATLNRSNLQQANFSGADLRGAGIRGADLRGAYLQEAKLAGANLVGADLRGADLRGADLQEAVLNRAVLNGAKLVRANLSGTDLDVAVGGNRLRRLVGRWFPLPGLHAAPFILDGQRIRGTMFSFASQDPWSILRRTYTGPKLAFIFLATVAGFLPLIAQALFWIAVAVAERRGIEAMLGPLEESSRIARGLPDPGARAWADEAEPAWGGLRSRLDGQPGAPFILDLKPIREAVERGREALIEVRSDAGSRLTAGQARDLETAAANLAEARRVFALVRPERAHVELRPHRIIALLLGWSEGFWPFLLAITALSYNLARFAFTFFFIVPLREESDRNQRAPRWSDYRPLWHAHQVLSVLVLVTYVSLAILIATKVVPALWMKVLVPVRTG